MECDFHSANFGWFQGFEFWPTLRIISAWNGLQFAVGTGEGFIHANEPTVFELLTGYRGESVLFLGGISRGISLRLDARMFEFTDDSEIWLSMCLGFKPWGENVRSGDGSARALFTAGVSWRVGNTVNL